MQKKQKSSKQSKQVVKKAHARMTEGELFRSENGVNIRLAKSQNGHWNVMARDARNHRRFSVVKAYVQKSAALKFIKGKYSIVG